MIGTRRQLQEARDIAIEARTEGRSHQSNCIEHNRRIEDMLTEGRVMRERQHSENQSAIEAVHGRVSALQRGMVLMTISALGSVVMALIGVLYSVFSKKMGL